MVSWNQNLPNNIHLQFLDRHRKRAQNTEVIDLIAAMIGNSQGSKQTKIETMSRQIEIVTVVIRSLLLIQLLEILLIQLTPHYF